jgi:hypothetical protein
VMFFFKKCCTFGSVWRGVVRSKICVAQLVFDLGKYTRDGRKLGHTLVLVFDKGLRVVWIFEPSSYFVADRICNMRPNSLNNILRNELKGYDVFW